MFSNLTNLWDTVKAGVQGHGPDSDSEKTEGPDSDGSVSPSSEHSATGTPGKPPSPTAPPAAPENTETTPPKEPTPVASPKAESPADPEDKAASEEPTDADSNHINQQIGEVSTKAINTAKEWGSKCAWLYTDLFVYTRYLCLEWHLFISTNWSHSHR